MQPEQLASNPQAKPPHIIEKERRQALLARARVVRDTLGKRNTEITGQRPDKVYMWVNVKEERQITFQAMGWTLCTDPDVTSAFKQADNTHRRADVVLYEIDRDFYEALEADNILRGIEGIEQAESSFVTTLLKDRVPVFKPQVA